MKLIQKSVLHARKGIAAPSADVAAPAKSLHALSFKPRSKEQQQQQQQLHALLRVIHLKGSKSSTLLSCPFFMPFAVKQGLARKVIKATQREEPTRLTGSSQEWDEDAEGTMLLAGQHLVGREASVAASAVASSGALIECSTAATEPMSALTSDGF
ncbi:hypothetical protein ACLKA6_002115 [Drosophila palustris]